MQITFDPLNRDEAAFVRRVLDVHADAPEVPLAEVVRIAPSVDARSLDDVPPPPPPALEATETDGTQDAEPPKDPPHVDARGLPWDSRIHSGNRALVADGTWRKRRGVDDDVVAQVEAELRAVMAVPAPVDAAEVFKPEGVPPPPPPAGAATASVPASTPPPPPPPAASTSDAAPADFAQFMARVLPRITAGTLTHEQVREAVREAGLASVENLLARPDLVGDVYRRLPK